jgi:hypothetical protein
MQTRTKTDPQSGHVYVVTYGFHAINGQKPYLSVTGEHWAGQPMRKSERNLISMGCNHDMIGVQFPDLAALIPFHLCDADGVPMHYVANTVYHAANRAFAYARSTAVWPDATAAELSVPADELRAALVARLPSVRAAMIAACEACGVPIPAPV